MWDAVTVRRIMILSNGSRSAGRLCAIVESIVRNEILSNCGNSYITRRVPEGRRRDGKNDAEARSDQLFSDMDVF